MSTLTDRYVWGVLRAVPVSQRPELEPEIRALIADAVEARASGDVSAAGVERAALSELGDPEALAARYTGRRLYLIGPSTYLTWSRTLALLPIVAAIAGIIGGTTAALAAEPMGQIIAAGVTGALNAVVYTAVAFTLVFAAIERAGSGPVQLREPWSPDRLPELPTRRGVTAVETAVSVIAILVGVGALAWQQLAKPIVIDGVGYPLFNVELWSFWLPWFVVVLGLDIAFVLARWARGAWSWRLAAVNAVLTVAFAAPAVWLLQAGRLFDPGLIAALEDAGHGQAIDIAVTLLTVVGVASATWGAIDGFRQAAGQAPAR